MQDRTCTSEGCERSGRMRRGLCDLHYQRRRRDEGFRHVSDRDCSVEGCDGPVRGQGLCGMHYARLLRTGVVGPAARKNLPAPAECIVDGCTTIPLAKGLCATHRSRTLKHGDPLARAFAPRGQCRIPGCDAQHYARGLCAIHYGRQQRHGDPEQLDKPAGDKIGYGGQHHIIRNVRGPADAHQCQRCDRPAIHWAYDHTDPDERRDSRRGGPYSLDPYRYMPLCGSCHRAFDISIAEQAAGSSG